MCPLVAECGGPRSSPSATRKQGEFVGSSRYYRGRLLDALRVLPSRGTVAMDELVCAIAPNERERLEILMRRLAHDGLVTIDADELVRLAE
jgi:hypothetical protein